MRRVIPLFLLVSIFVALAGCGKGNVFPVTSAASPTGPEASYKAAMQAWSANDLKILGSDALSGSDDPSNATSAELAALQTFSDRTHAALADLQSIKPSDASAQDHAGFVSAFAALVKVTDKFVNAVQTKNASDLPSIETEMSAASTQIVTAQTRLAVELGLPLPTTETTS